MTAAAAGRARCRARAALPGPREDQRHASRSASARPDSRYGGRLPAQPDIDLEPGGARIAVAGLADGAGIEKPPRGREVERGARGRLAASNLGAVPGELERDVAVADEDEWSGGGGKRPPGGVFGEHVVPHGIAWAAVEELRAGRDGAWSECRQKRTCGSVQHLARPRGRGARLAAERRERDLPEHD